MKDDCIGSPLNLKTCLDCRGDGFIHVPVPRYTRKVSCGELFEAVECVSCSGTGETPLALTVFNLAPWLANRMFAALIAVQIRWRRRIYGTA